MAAFTDYATWLTFRYSKSYLYIDQPAVVFEALVDETAALYPFNTFHFDNVSTGAYTDLEEGMRLMIGTTQGGDDLGNAVVLSATSSTITVGYTSEGVHDGELTLTNNAYITVTDDYRLQSWIPFIDLVTGTQYKKGSLTYLAGHPSPPVVIFHRGPVAIGFDDGTGYLTQHLDAFDSYATAPGASLTGVVWAIGDGTYVSGTSTSWTPTVKWPVGRRWIKATVTDDNGKTWVRRLLVVVLDRPGQGDFEPLQKFTVTSDEKDLATHGLSVNIEEPIPSGTYPDGTLVCLFEEEVYGDPTGTFSIESLAGSTECEHIKFVGWLGSNSDSLRNDQGFLADTRLECLGVASRLSKLPAFEQVVERETSPSSWYQMSTANIDRYVHYLLAWHSTVLSLTDFQWSTTGEVWPFYRMSSGGQSMWNQAAQRTQAIGYELTCDQTGQIRMVKDQMLLLEELRSATVMFACTEPRMSRLSYTHEHTPRAHWSRENAIIGLAKDAADLTGNDIVAGFTISPGQAPGQGLNAVNQGEQLIRTWGDLMIRAGNRYAARVNNANGQFQVELVSGGDAGIDPAYFDEWITVNVGTAYAAQRGYTWTTKRFLCRHRSVERSKSGNKVVRLTLEEEVIGTLAPIDITRSSSASSVYVPPTTTTPTDYSGQYGASELGHLPGALYSMWAIDDAGYGYLTDEWDTVTPNWVQQDLPTAGLTGTVLQWITDAFSYGSGSIDGFAITTTGIYKVADLAAGSPTVTEKYTWPFTYSTQDQVNVDGSFGEYGFYIVVWNDANGGTKAYYTTDNFETVTEVTITAFNETSVTFNHMPMLYVSSRTPGYAISAAFTATAAGTAPMGVYETPDYGANWSAKSADPSFATVHGLGGALEVPWDDNAAELVAYYGVKTVTDVGGGKQTFGFYRSVGAVTTNITPVQDGVYFMPRRGRWSIKSCPINRQRLVLAANGDKPDATIFGQRAVFVSADGGDNWEWIVFPVSRTGYTYTRAAISGDNENVIYLWGQQGRVGYSPNFGANIYDKRGNIYTELGAGEIIGIAGIS